MLRNQLKEEAVAALKSGDRKKTETIRFLVSLIDKRELQLPPGALTEAEELNVLRKELKNKEESREMFAKAGRNDLVEEQNYEIELVKAYLPSELGEDEVRKIVEEVVVEKGKIFGMVMGETMKRTAGRVGGEVVSKIVKEVLAA